VLLASFFSRGLLPALISSAVPWMELCEREADGRPLRSYVGLSIPSFSPLAFYGQIFYAYFGCSLFNHNFPFERLLEQLGSVIECPLFEQQVSLSFKE